MCPWGRGGEHHCEVTCEGDQERHAAPWPEQGKEGGGEPLEVHRGGGEERLDAHVLEPALYGARKTVVPPRRIRYIM